MEPLKIIIVDDQKLFRQNLRIIIEMWIPEAKVVGLASNGYEALELCRTTPHNLILLDIRMPEMDGVAFIRHLRKEGDHAKVIVLTTFDDDEYIFEALRQGAVGYLLKDIDPEELTSAIINVQNGGTLMSPQIAAKLVSEATRYRTADLIRNDSDLAILTPRELEVLLHLAAGKNNREIAADIQLAEGTVKNHVSNIYEKLGLTDRAQAVRFALEHKLIR
jgi:DNA-binding NarL/FixJ family response regulator